MKRKATFFSLIGAAALMALSSVPAEARISANRISFNRIAANRIAFNRIAFNRIAFNRISFNQSQLNCVFADPALLPCALDRNAGAGAVITIGMIELADGTQIRN